MAGGMSPHATGSSPAMRLVLVVVFLLLLAAPATARTRADGAPGTRPTWTQADKHAFGTSNTPASRVWFTLRQRELTEVFFPDLGTPAIRSLEFVVSRPGAMMTVDRETLHGTGTVERLDGLNYRQTVTDRGDRWRLTKTYTTDPGARRRARRRALRVAHRRAVRAARAARPRARQRRRATTARARSAATLVANDRRMTSALAASPAFTATSSGYAGTSDPWMDLRDDGSLDANADARSRGNVRQAATTSLNGTTSQQLTLALGFGTDHVTARRQASEALAAGFAPLAAQNAAGWAAWRATLKPAPAAAAPVADAYETSLLMLAAHDDKRNPGAGVASPTMPWAWGRLTVDKKDKRSAPYHLVWPRDLYQVATARDRGRATPTPPTPSSTSCSTGRSGRTATSRRTCRSTGRQKWTGIQMDEQAFPIVLAWQLERFDAATWRKLRRTAEFILRHGPGTEQDRWENQERLLAGDDRGRDRRAGRRRRPGAPQRRDGRRRPLRARRRPLGRRRPALDGDHQRPVLGRALLPAADEGPPAGPRHALQHRRRRPRAGRPAQGRRPELPRARAARRQAVRRPGDPQHARGGRPAAARDDAERRLLAPLRLRRLRREPHGRRLADHEGGLAPDLRPRCGRSSPASAASTSCWPGGPPTPT